MACKATMAALVAVLMVVAPVDSLVAQRALVAPPQRVGSGATLVMRKGRPSTRIKPKKQAATSESQKLDWVEVAASEVSEVLPQECGGIKAAEIRGNTYAIVRRTDSWFAIEASCSKCKFPLLSAKLVEEGDDASLECSLCGATYRASDGKLTGVEKKEGLAGMFGNFLSNNVGKDMSTYELRTAPNGKVYINFGPLP